MYSLHGNITDSKKARLQRGRPWMIVEKTFTQLAWVEGVPNRRKAFTHVISSTVNTWKKRH